MSNNTTLRLFNLHENIARASSGTLGKNIGVAKTNLDPESTSPLFRPFTIRGLTFKNRVIVPPMCMYSAIDGVASAWHVQHLGQFAVRGAAGIIVEATGVTPNGRITPNCLGLWNDEQVEALKPTIKFCHEFGALIGIQLAHAGRKASSYSPFHNGDHNTCAPVEDGGWPDNVVAPSAIKGWPTHAEPKELTIPQIKELVQAFSDSAVRAINAGFDFVEIHGAHGYLLHTFLSPLTNLRKDEYGGDLPNRIRFAEEVVAAVRAVIPDSMPLFVRLSCTDRHPQGLKIEDTLEIARVLKRAGADVIDCSSGLAVADQDFSYFFQAGHNVEFAAAIKKGVPELVTAVAGNITEAKQAEKVVGDGESDFVLIGREMLRNPSFVLDAAATLGAEVVWPYQYRRAKKI